MRRFELIRSDIKALSDAQRLLKPQRKTVHFTGERIQNPQSAATLVVLNREVLMHLYIAYAILKGKEPQLPKNKPYMKDMVDAFVKKYQPQEETV